MTPTRAQYIFARHWLIDAWMVGVPLVLVITAVRISGFTVETLGDVPSLFYLVAIILLSGFFGFFTALFCGWFIFRPFYFARGRKNGAPFSIGDRVHILVGPHRDAVVCVYEVRGADRQVRVELGEEAERSGADMFYYHEVCREVMPNTALEPTPTDKH